MSLFPAYQSDNPELLPSDTKNEAKKGESSWLSNPSFSIEVSQIPLPPDSNHAEPSRSDSPDSPPNRKNDQAVIPESDRHRERSESPDSYSRSKSSKHKKVKSHHKHKRRKHQEDKQEVKSLKKEENFYEDKRCEKGNLMVPTLARPAIPLYHVLRGCTVGDVNVKRSSKKKIRVHRYYTQLKKLYESQPEETRDAIPNSSDDKREFEENQENQRAEITTDNRLEEELTKNTAQYNKNLAEQPSNVELWLKYARFQDVVWQFEKTYRRGGGARGARVTAERKLAILDKALQHNPGSDQLLKEKISVSESVYPADTLSQQLKDMLDRQPSNLALWHGYVGATQCSLAMCTVPAVSKLYCQAMERLHQLRRGAPASQTKLTEEKILALLFDCGLFLRQAGLWEQLWLLLRMYLELNLTHPDSKYFNIVSTLPEHLVSDTEEGILSSKLPLSEIWLRIEQLREGAHWLPWSSDEECEDPQRIVFSEDVSDFLHPITTQSLMPNLAALALLLLKVPLLPFRDSALRTVIPHMKPWGLDSVEMFLPALYPIGTVDLDCFALFKDITKLSVGPQYLDQRLGQENYLEFVIKVFQLCSDSLSEPSRTAFCIWWLRFERLLIILDRLGICKLPQARKKKVKSIIKDFLKQERNRNCLLFYQEYALVEWELGHHDSACKILLTAITAQPVPVISVVNEQERSGLCCLYRTLSELYLCRSRLQGEDALVNKQKAVSVLMALSFGKPISTTENRSFPPLEELVAASEKYRHIATELMQDVNADTTVTVSDHLLPDMAVAWISCHAWLLFLTHSTWAAGALMEDILEKIPQASDASNTSVSLMSCRRELLYETYVNMLHHHCVEAAGTYSVLRELEQRAMKEFPNNLYFLATAAKLQAGSGGVGSPWWKVRRYFSEADSLMSHMFLVLLARQRYTQKESLTTSTHSFLHTAGPIVPDKSTLNLLGALFSQLERHSLTKRNPLMWRLYLRFLYDHSTEGTVKTAFYRAVEACPWVKVLYIDASKLVPEELPQIQDLIIEKEMRLHVTPEELDILRSIP